MKYQPVLSAKAVKTLDKLNRNLEQRVQARLDELALNPLDPRISSALETAAGLRYSRVGDWRIIYEVDEGAKTLVIITIQHRSQVYKEVKK